jgi:prevent-host-death family protein
MMEESMARIKTDKARAEFGSVINRVAYGHERIVLERRGKPMAAMIPMEDLRLLERLIEEEEDRIDLAAIEAAIAEGGEEVSLEAFMKEIRADGQTGRSIGRRAAKPKKAARG